MNEGVGENNVCNQKAIPVLGYMKLHALLVAKIVQSLNKINHEEK